MTRYQRLIDRIKRRANLMKKINIIFGKKQDTYANNRMEMLLDTFGKRYILDIKQDTQADDFIRERVDAASGNFFSTIIKPKDYNFPQVSRETRCENSTSAATGFQWYIGHEPDKQVVFDRAVDIKTQFDKDKSALLSSLDQIVQSIKIERKGKLGIVKSGNKEIDTYVINDFFPEPLAKYKSTEEQIFSWFKEIRDTKEYLLKDVETDAKLHISDKRLRHMSSQMALTFMPKAAVKAAVESAYDSFIREVNTTLGDRYTNVLTQKDRDTRLDAFTKPVTGQMSFDQNRLKYLQILIKNDEEDLKTSYKDSSMPDYKNIERFGELIRFHDQLEAEKLRYQDKSLLERIKDVYRYAIGDKPSRDDAKAHFKEIKNGWLNGYQLTLLNQAPDMATVEKKLEAEASLQFASAYKELEGVMGVREELATASIDRQAEELARRANKAYTKTAAQEPMKRFSGLYKLLGLARQAA